MITKYKINKDELLININLLYEFKNKITNSKKIIKLINSIIINNQIKFKGNKIIIYLNGIYIGEIYLTNYYLKKLNNNYLKNEINNTNSYFNKANIVEIKPNGKYLTKSIFKY